MKFPLEIIAECLYEGQARDQYTTNPDKQGWCNLTTEQVAYLMDRTHVSFKCPQSGKNIGYFHEEFRPYRKILVEAKKALDPEKFYYLSEIFTHYRDSQSFVPGPWIAMS